MTHHKSDGFLLLKVIKKTTLKCSKSSFKITKIMHKAEDQPLAHQRCKLPALLDPLFLQQKYQKGGFFPDPEQSR